VTQHKLTSRATLWALAATLLGLGYSLAQVKADGAPKAQPLWYAGTVADAAGIPLEGNHSVALRLFAALSGGSPACTAGPSNIAFQKGRFRLDASAAACTAAVAANPDLFAELSVDDKAFPRSKIGATPYAIEAGRAVEATRATTAMTATSATSAMTATNATNAMTATNATNATTARNAENASGALKTQIDGLAAAVTGLGSVRMQSFVKRGNNGAVTCDLFCSSAQWGGGVGGCLGAYSQRGSQFVACSAELGASTTANAEVTCFCARFE
jgi:hypothetical protein